MAPEAAAKAMRAYAEETNRINRERRASGASDRKELADVEKKIASMIAVIEDGGYVRGMVDRLRELEARQDELNERLAAGAHRPAGHPPQHRGHLPAQGGPACRGAGPPGGPRRRGVRDPRFDRAHRAHSRREMGRDGRRAARRSRDHPRMGGKRGAKTRRPTSPCRRCRSRWLRG